MQLKSSYISSMLAWGVLEVFFTIWQFHIIIWQMLFIIHLAISGGHLPYIGFYLKATFITTFSQLKQFLSLSIFCFALQVLVTLWLLQILFWQVLVSVFGNLLWYGKRYICILRVFDTCSYVIKLNERGGFIYFLCYVCLLYCNTLEHTKRAENQTRTNLV